MKKLLSLVMVLVMAFTLCVPAFATEEKPFTESEFYTVGDYRLHYRIFESDAQAKKQILLIHGFCLSTVSLEGVAEEYKKQGYRTVLVDVPNFGYSSRETSDTNFLSREEVIGSLMLSLGGEWVVGGHSMGGGIALNLATDYPENVKGLVLFAPQSSAESQNSFARSSVMQLLYKIILNFFLKFPFLVRMFVSTSFSDSGYAKTYDLSRVMEPLSLDGTGEGITIMTSHTRGNDFGKIKALSIPTVIVTAKEDKVASAENLQQIINNAPEGARVIEIEKGGHMMMEYAPAEVAEKTFETIENS